MSKGQFIADRWINGEGDDLVSIDPATGETIWQGGQASANQINGAVQAARGALEHWSNCPLETRIEVLNRFAAELKNDRTNLAQLISRETGKPLWESLTEVDSMIGKVAVSIGAIRQRRSDLLREQNGVTSAIRYKAHGVIAVLGPFNFPGHLPNGHIVPALLAGNTLVFKPSELTPAVGEHTVELWLKAGLPAGVLNYVQGAAAVGKALVTHHDIDGVFFTGSFNAGRAINMELASFPGKMVALEMGGNNPLVIWEVADVKAAAYATIQSAYITAGQRCSCARRLIVSTTAAGDAFLNRLQTMIKTIRVGDFRQTPEPFMGPVISDSAAERLLRAQLELIESGAKPLVEMKVAGARKVFLSPGLIDVTSVRNRPDEELFGPILQVIRVDSFDAAIVEANRTQFGLAAGLLSDDRYRFEEFYRRVRAGVVNWNRPLTGASSALPFGGVGRSGNNRPSAFFAADYSSYPIASIESERLVLPEKLTPGISIDA